MKYSIPEEPKVGSKVITKNGNVYERKDTDAFNNWEWNGLVCSWTALVQTGAEDYIENGYAEQKYEDDDFFGEIRIYIDGVWNYFFWNTITKKFQRMEEVEVDPNDKREWRSVNAYS